MRDGRTVANTAIGETSKLALIADMLGRDIDEIRTAGMTELGGGHAQAGDVLVEATAVATDRRLRRLDMVVRRGEIVGLAGLLGSGRTEAARAIFGVDTPVAGTISVSGRQGAPRSPAAAIRAGIGFLSEDRKAEGIVPELSVRENISLAVLHRLGAGWQIDRKRERELAASMIKALGIKVAHMDQPIRELSGGNQQKALLARWLAIEPDLLILDEPTRGVDVGAKLEIQAIIREAVGKGVGVVLISSEFEELIEGADRIVVMQDGYSVAVLENPGITESSLVKAIAHHQAVDAA
jgi:ribose transport system ATP-binding protein